MIVSTTPIDIHPTSAITSGKARRNIGAISRRIDIRLPQECGRLESSHLPILPDTTSALRHRICE
jgi:hypothetical protein